MKFGHCQNTEKCCLLSNNINFEVKKKPANFRRLFLIEFVGSNTNAKNKY